jgi:hypothetical protein
MARTERTAAVDMKAMGFAVLAIVGIGSMHGAQTPGQETGSALPRWEYRVLNKPEIIDLGKKDLAAGLNQLGDEGWELVAIDAAYIFKRPKVDNRKQAETLRNQIALLEDDAAQLKDRVAWSERMARKGFMTNQQVEGERTLLKRVELALERARTDLKRLPAAPREGLERERKPER